MKKNMSWKFTDELSITFQSSLSGPGEFGLYSRLIEKRISFVKEKLIELNFIFGHRVEGLYTIDTMTIVVIGSFFRTAL